MLGRLPIELFHSHIFEYLLGPIEQYKVDESITIQSIWKIKNELNRFDLDNLKGLNSLSCVNSDMRRLFIPESDEGGKLNLIDSFWLNVANLVELINYFTRYEEYSHLYLTIGDLNHYEKMEMADIQSTLENVEMGFQTPVNENALMCEKSFVERMIHLITSESKYLKIREKTVISVYELFIFKSHIMCLGMVPNFDSQKQVDRYFSYYGEHEHTLLALHLNSKHLGKGCLGLVLDEFDANTMPICSNYLSITAVTLWSTISSINFTNTLQYLSLVVRLEMFNEVDDMFEKCNFPNVKFLSISIQDEISSVQNDIERYKHIEKKLLENINKETFPKLIHLSLKGFFDWENISNINILDQLICLEIITGHCGYGFEQNFAWRDGMVMNLLKKTYLNDSFDNCMQLLIIYNTINIRWIDGDLETMQDYYNRCRERSFVGSISPSSVLTYYSTCQE